MYVLLFLRRVVLCKQRPCDGLIPHRRSPKCIDGSTVSEVDSKFELSSGPMRETYNFIFVYFKFEF
jgi:hypothetical protein